MANREIFMRTRVLFTINGCHHCHIWSEVVERYNTKMPLSKRIRVVDCTKYYDFNIITDPIIRLYSKFIKGNYPTLFFEGEKVDGANSREEVEAWLLTRLFDDFIVDENNSAMFNKDCQYQDTIFGRKPVCR